MCLFSDISYRVSEIIPADRSRNRTVWYSQSDQINPTPLIAGQLRSRLSSVESTLLSIVPAAISTQHEDDQASQRRLTTVFKSQQSTSQTDCVESSVHSVASVVTSQHLNESSLPSRPALHGLTNKYTQSLAHTTSLLFPLNGSLLY